MAKTIRWGIVGCGDVTERKSGPGFQKSRNSALVAVMRRDAAKAADYAKRHGVPTWYSDADKLINDPQVDAVYVATPPGQHELYAMEALAVGKPCYVEKPFTRNAPEAERIVAAFAQKRVPLFVAYYRRGLPRFLKAREIVQSGQIGTLAALNYRYADGQSLSAKKDNLPWRLVAEQSGAGIFLDLASHALDIIDFMVGPLGNATGHAANIAGTHAVEDVVALKFSLQSGGIGAASWCFASAVKEDIIEITGTHGRIVLSAFGNEPVQLHTRDGVQTFDLPNPDPIQGPLIQTIVNDLNGEGKCESTGVTALRTQQIMDAALVSYYGGREDGFWRRPWPGAPKL